MQRVELTFHALVSIHLQTYIVLHGYFSLGKNSRPITRELSVRIYSGWYYVRSGVGVSARGIRSAMSNIFGPKSFSI